VGDRDCCGLKEGGRGSCRISMGLVGLPIYRQRVFIQQHCYYMTNVNTTVYV
jgi:hypothetical protein